jgi:hypothetical protein
MPDAPIMALFTAFLYTIIVPSGETTGLNAVTQLVIAIQSAVSFEFFLYISCAAFHFL